MKENKEQKKTTPQEEQTKNELEEKDKLKDLEEEQPDPEDLEGEPDPDLMQNIPVEVRIKAFIQGEITLADLYGLPHEQLYDIAQYGKMLFDQGKIEEAETIFTALTALDPYDANFHAGLGAVYQKQGKNEEAIVEYDRALQCNNFHIPSLVNRAELKIMKGALAEAAEDLKKAIELDPEGKDPHSQRARGLALAVASTLQELAEKKKN